MEQKGGGGAGDGGTVWMEQKGGGGAGDGGTGGREGVRTIHLPCFLGRIFHFLRTVAIFLLCCYFI